MSFYERYVELCSERGVKPQNPEMLQAAGVSSGSISGWKKGSDPKIEVLRRLSEYFDCTVDYLIGLSEVRKAPTQPILTEEESLLLEAFRGASTQGRFNIITVCMNEKAKGATVNAG